MATRYWVLGSGTWDATTTTNWSTTSGGLGGASAPTSADDVIFDANSNVLTTAFTVTVGNTANCLSFSTGGAGGALDAVMTLSLGTTSDLNVYGSLTLPATNFTWTGVSSSLIFSSSTTGNTITTNGVVLVSTVIIWNNVNGGWTLGSALTNTTNTCQLVAGSLDTGDYNVSLQQVIFSGALTRTLTLGSSTVTLGGQAPWNYSGSNLTLNAGTSTINCAASTITFTGGGLTYYNVRFNSTVAVTLGITGANTFNNLVIAARAASGIGTLSFESAVTNTINGTLTLGSGTPAVNRLQVNASTVGSPATLSVATLAAITNIDFRDITASGASAPWSGTRIGNCLGCTNITFATPRTVYWNSAASASWSGAVWSTTSGNTGGSINNFPLAQDTVVIDDAGLTAGDTITWNALWNVGAINFSSRTNAMTFGNGVNSIAIYGSLTLSSAVTLTGTAAIGFRNQGLTATITSAGVPFTQPINILVPSGTVAINDNLTTNDTITHTSGNIIANYNLTCLRFVSSNANTRAITFGGNVISLTGTGTVWNTATTTGLTLSAGTSTISLTDNSATARSFSGGGLTYWNLQSAGTTGGSTLTIIGNNTFNAISSNKTVAHSILFTAGSTTTLNDFLVSGSAGNLVTISSPTAAFHTLVKVGTSNVSCNYLNISYSHAS